MNPNRQPTSEARRGRLGRLSKALSLGRSLAALCAERARYRTRQEPPTAMYPQVRFVIDERGASPCGR